MPYAWGSPGPQWGPCGWEGSPQRSALGGIEHFLRGGEARRGGAVTLPAPGGEGERPVWSWTERPP